jgi:penicillin-binding protein 1A
VGYTPQVVLGVWVGYDDKTTLGTRNSGGVIACPIWAHIMRRAFKGKESVDFPVPLTGVTVVNIDGNTGYLASPSSKNEYSEAFLSGTEPRISLIRPTTEQIINEATEGEDAVIKTVLEKPEPAEENVRQSTGTVQQGTGTVH